MKQVVQDVKTGKVMVIEVPAPIPSKGMVLVRNYFSAISVGTERSSVEVGKKNLLGKAQARPDLVKKVMESVKKEGLAQAMKKVRSRLESYKALGYSSAGEVIGIGEGVTAFASGDKVACGGGDYAVHAEVVCIPANLCVPIPKGVDVRHAAFSTIGAIALHSVRRAEIDVGDRVAVIGLGLIGQMVAQLCKIAGAHVIGVDIDKKMISLARKLGTDSGVLSGSDVEAVVDRFTEGMGMDAVIIAAGTKSSEPVDLAARIVRNRGRIVALGAVGMNLDRGKFYEKEIDLRLSRSYGPGRYDKNYEEKGLDYPIGYVRWTENRNMREIVSLLAKGKLMVEPLITHTFRIDTAVKAYDLLSNKARVPSLGIVIEYPRDKLDIERKVEARSLKESGSVRGAVNIALIGAGNFAQSYILPNLRSRGVFLHTVVDSVGQVAKRIGEKYRFRNMISDYTKLLDDKTISTAFIATRHNLHARMIIDFLKAGRNVYCEKPLCINEKELNVIIHLYNQINQKDEKDKRNQIFMVGFNRRFAPLTRKSLEFMGAKIGPYVMNYRINAGLLPRDHWLHDPDVGGGRIVGEVCHFVDLLQFVAQAQPTRVFAERLKTGSEKVPDDDSVSISIRFDDGSIGNIQYFAIGDGGFPKERLEVFGDGKACVIDDFREGIFSKEGRKTLIRQSQDKGHRQEINAFVDAVKTGKPSPIRFDQIVAATAATFAIAESIATGRPIDLPPIAVTE